MHKYIIIIASVLIAALTAAPAMAQEQQDSTAYAIRERINAVVSQNAGLLEVSQVGICVWDLTADSAIYTLGHRQLMRPASTQKVLTSIAALHQLGSQHTFRTTLATQPDTMAPDSTHWYGNLIVRGGMDPTFGHDDLQAMVSAVKGLKADTIVGRIILDLKFKDASRLGWGWCWDDNNPILSPLLYECHDTFAHKFLEQLRGRGIVVTGGVEIGSTPAAAKVICTRATSIDKVLDRALKQSDNQYAESIFYQLGATRKQAAAKVEYMLKSAGQADYFQVADGSGLSLYNYTTPEALVRALRYAHKQTSIYRHLYPALPIAGTDGTLRKRMTKGDAYGNVHAKTGTVEGVSSLAGYATAANGHQLAFAIINQGVSRSELGRNFQDAVCQAMCQAQ